MVEQVWLVYANTGRSTATGAKLICKKENILNQDHEGLSGCVAVVGLHGPSFSHPCGKAVQPLQFTTSAETVSAVCLFT